MFKLPAEGVYIWDGAKPYCLLVGSDQRGEVGHHIEGPLRNAHFDPFDALQTLHNEVLPPASTSQAGKRLDAQGCCCYIEIENECAF